MKKVAVGVMAALCMIGATADELRIPRRKPLTANVGVVSVGLDTYWDQCPGLLDDMKRKEDVFVGKLFVS